MISLLCLKKAAVWSPLVAVVALTVVNLRRASRMVGGYEADGPIPISVPAPVPIASINEERKILRPPIVVSARGETYQNHNVSQHAGQTEHGDENDQLTSRVGAKTARFQNSLTPSELNNQSNGASDETGDSIFRHLDFAIIGHAKSGTSFMLNHWLRFHPDIRLPRNETRILREEEGATKIARLMKGLRKNDARALCGYKCPSDVGRLRSLRRFRDFFPHTKLIIGVRHPVKWYQSFMNFHNRTRDDGTVPNGTAPRIEGSNFHTNLAMFGFTNQSTMHEKTLLSTLKKRPPPLVPALPNQIFFYDVSQMDVTRDAKVAESFRQDLSSFLGLKSPLPPLFPWKGDPRVDKKDFKICEPRHREAREELLRIGRAASTWILEYLLDQPTVHVSSRDDLERLIARWKEDPCEPTNVTDADASIESKNLTRRGASGYKQKS